LKAALAESAMFTLTLTSAVAVFCELAALTTIGEPMPEKTLNWPLTLICARS
jgi:hypothetical protein